MKKIFLVVILIFVLLFSVSYAKNFSDVNASFWAYGPINEMLNDKSEYEFKYGLADEDNLILSDCVFEFINFNNKSFVE